MDEVRKENKKLTYEIKDLMDQITEGGRSIHEIDKIRKRLEAEILELESAVNDAESALEQEENKVDILMELFSIFENWNLILNNFFLHKYHKNLTQALYQ